MQHKTFRPQKMIKKTVALALIVLAFGASKAQQYPQFTHFSFNKILFNPAAAGESGYFCVNANNHQQYRGLNEPPSELNLKTNGANGAFVSNNLKNIAPFTSAAGIQAPVMIKGKNYGGAYFSFMDDKVAYEQNTYMKFGIAGAYPIYQGATIRLGVDFTSLTKTLRTDKFHPHDPNDPRIPVGGNSVSSSTLGAGVYFRDSSINNLYVGLSAVQLIPQDFVYGNVSIQTALHGFLVAGMQIDNFLGNQAFRLDPNVSVKFAKDISGIVRPTIDLQGLFVYNNTFAGGLNYRTAMSVQSDAISIMLGYYPQLKSTSNLEQNLRIGYAYDIPLQAINTNGTHEIQVNYCFRLSLPPPTTYRIPHPRDMQRPGNFD